MKQLHIEKIIDQYGWSYDFIGREQQRYTRHKLIISRYDEVKFDNIDVIYIHSPNIDPDLSNNVPLQAKEKGIKVIGAYGGDPKYWHTDTEVRYSYCDLIVAISPETYKFANKIWKDKPVIFLPESVDTEYFKFKELNDEHFNVGWAGSKFPIKRIELLEQLKYEVIKMSEWGFDLFKKNRSHDYMRDFYHNLNCFVLTSKTECMPRVIMEAMSCGLPIVCTNVGNIPFLLDENWIVSAEPKEAVVSEMNEKLKELHDDFDLQTFVGLRNRKWIEDKFSWKVNQPMWDDVFENLANDNIDKIIEDNKKYLDLLDSEKKYFPVDVKITKNIKIAYLVPGTGISGGIAVVLQHANRLIDKGYDVILLLNEGKEEELSWFKGNKVPIISSTMDYRYAADDIDILIATGWEAASRIFSTDTIQAKRKIYFVQSDERRFTDNVDVKKLIDATYKMEFEYMTEARWIQKWLKEEYGHEVQYVPNGLDEKIFRPADCVEPKRERVRILIEGPIDIPFKGVAKAYNAVKNFDCEIWFVSSAGVPKENWRYDRFFSKVPLNEMKHIYSSCDILLKLSSVEGLFGPPMEAMACGCSVVVGKVTGYDEYIVDGYNAFVVDINDYQGIVSAVKRLIDDKNLREQLITNGFKTVKEWTWNKSIDLLEKVIENKKIEQIDSVEKPDEYDYKIQKDIIEDNKNKCDIIIVTFNAVHIVKRCIDSIKKYTKFPHEIIIVDNASDYETRAYLESIQGINNIRIIFNDRNYGFAYANNQGINLSQNKYVCFLNSDTIVTDGWLSKMIHIFDEKGAGMVGPVTNYVSSTCQKVHDFDYEHNYNSNDDSIIQNYSKERYKKFKNGTIETQRLVGFCFVSQKDVLKEVGKFDERFEIGMFEDDDLGFRVLERGYPLFCCNGVFIYHFGGESFKHAYKQKTNEQILNKNRDIFVKKWYDTNRIQYLNTRREPLKIHYLLAADGPSGGVKVVFEHANRLKDRGHDVKIYCAMNETNAQWFNVRVPIIYGNLDNVGRCDIAIGTYFTTLDYLKKIRASVKLHLCQGYEGFLHADNNIKENIKLSYNNVKNKVAVSKWLKQVIQDEFKECKIDYISNGIDQYIFPFKRHKRNNIQRVLISGTEQLGIKGVHIAIEAVKGITDRKLQIVRLSSWDQVDKSVSMEYYNMTNMTQDEIAKVYASCDVTICASYKVEGFGLPPLESMAAGTPVITTDSGGVNDYAVNNENAIIVPQGHVQAIRHNLRLLLENEKLYNKLADNGIQTAKKYYWYHKIDEFENYYYNLLKESKTVKDQQLAVCMIVKNEEEKLEACLKSVKDVATEFIIVDTGSTDDTVKIARKYGSNIFHYKWDNNFAAARNFALEKVTAPWILIMDADEIIAKKDLNKLRKLLSNGDKAYNFVTRNYTNIEGVEGMIHNDNSYPEGSGYKGWCISTKIRLFPNKKGIHFKGEVHELVEESVKKSGMKVEESEIFIHHYGYIERNKNKEKRYAELGKTKLKKNKNDLNTIIELADQYLALNNYDEALVLWRRALKIKPDNPTFLAKMGTTYNLLRDFNEAEIFFKRSLNIKSTDYCCEHLGICYAKQERWQEAYDILRKVVYTTENLRTKANYAHCCNMLSKFDEAIGILESCLKIDREQTISWHLLEISYNEKGLILAKKGKFSTALQLFNSALRINPKFKIAQMNIAEINRIMKASKRKIS